MDIDLGTTSPTGPILKKDLFARQDDLLVLAATPGIPLEWIHAVWNLRYDLRRQLKKLMTDHMTMDHVEAGRANAGTVVDVDGRRMLDVIPNRSRYTGAVPLWSQLWLSTLPRGGLKAAARELGVSESKAGKWRTRSVFDVVSGRRVIGRRGGVEVAGGMGGVGAYSDFLE